MMEAASTSETSVKFFQTTRRNNPEESHLHTRHRENLKSLKGYMFNGASKKPLAYGVMTYGQSLIAAMLEWYVSAICYIV
jgi:hypothetical protein